MVRKAMLNGNHAFDTFSCNISTYLSKFQRLKRKSKLRFRIDKPISNEGFGPFTWSLLTDAISHQELGILEICLLLTQGFIIEQFPSFKKLLTGGADGVISCDKKNREVRWSIAQLGER